VALSAVAVCLAVAGCTGTSGGRDAATIAPGTSALNGFQNGRIPVGHFTSLSCPAAGGCTAAGIYTDRQGLVGVFALDQADGMWRSARPLPGLAALDSGQVPQGGSETGWPNPSIHLFGSGKAVSCAPVASCVAAGYVMANDLTRLFVITQ